MAEDKRRARKHAWRISERTLFAAALLGGSLGAILGMYLWHHKTKHWYFVIGMPLILVAQIAVGIWMRGGFWCSWTGGNETGPNRVWRHRQGWRRRTSKHKAVSAPGRHWSAFGILIPGDCNKLWWFEIRRILLHFTVHMGGNLPVENDKKIPIFIWHFINFVKHFAVPHLFCAICCENVHILCK